MRPRASHAAEQPAHPRARMLADNKEENLTAKQVEYARTIGAAGTDLLNLINDVLDLSKVEAGKVEIIGVEVGLAGAPRAARAHLPSARAAEGGIGLALELDPQVPPIFQSDLQSA